MGRHRKSLDVRQVAIRTASGMMVAVTVIAGTIVIVAAPTAPAASAPIASSAPTETVGLGAEKRDAEELRSSPVPSPSSVTTTPVTVAPPASRSRRATAEKDAPAHSSSTDEYPTTGYDGVKPHVAIVGHFIESRFNLSFIIGVGSRSRTSDHPGGYALDFGVGPNVLMGNLIAECVLDHFDPWHVAYVIWRQRINYGNGWEQMEDRGGVTANHYDHVHVSFDRGDLSLPTSLSC